MTSRSQNYRPASRCATNLPACRPGLVVGHHWEDEDMAHDPLCAFAPCDCYKDGSGMHSCGTDTCQCDLIAKVRTDERSRWNTPYFSVEYHRGYRQAQQDERQRWVETITSRIEDLRFCGKDDDCETKADGAELALDDGLYVSHAQT